jgi:hypothetical protein
MLSAPNRALSLSSGALCKTTHTGPKSKRVGSPTPPPLSAPPPPYRHAREERTLAPSLSLFLATMHHTHTHTPPTRCVLNPASRFPLSVSFYERARPPPLSLSHTPVRPPPLPETGFSPPAVCQWCHGARLGHFFPAACGRTGLPTYVCTAVLVP